MDTERTEVSPPPVPPRSLALPLLGALGGFLVVGGTLFVSPASIHNGAAMLVLLIGFLIHFSAMNTQIQRERGRNEALEQENTELRRPPAEV